MVVTAVMVITMMVGVGLAIFSTVGTQQSESRKERNRDSAFNLAESALYSQAFILSKNWPNANTNPGWTCTQAVTVDGLCPSYSSLQNSVAGASIADLSTGIQWRIQVRDNAGQTDYVTDPASSSYTPNQPAFDNDKDHRLWVRADAWSQGKERSLVALLQLEQFKEPFPQNVITAGHFQTDNQGNKALINTQGDSATGSQVVVHCVNTDPSCADYNSDKGQVDPPRTDVDATGHEAAPVPVPPPPAARRDSSSTTVFCG